MLKDSKLDDKFWAQEIDITALIINRGILRNNCNMIHELWKGRSTNVK